MKNALYILAPLAIISLLVVSCSKPEAPIVPEGECENFVSVSSAQHGIVFEGSLVDFFSQRNWKPDVLYTVTIDGTTEGCYKGKYLITFTD